VKNRCEVCKKRLQGRRDTNTCSDRCRQWRHRRKRGIPARVTPKCDVSVHFSSRTYEWGTPQNFFDKLNEEFGVKLDVCATAENAKCANFYTPEQDGLKQPWTGVCWMNPPYGRAIGKWLAKAVAAAREGATEVALNPYRPDPHWWDYAEMGEVRRVKGRLKFTSPEGTKHSAPFPSAVVVFLPPAVENEVKEAA
jgi:phage N-6-adenine-methyltransferase